MHDYAYYLGFDEPHWNSQQYNNGLGGAANDGLLGNCAGGRARPERRDNANMCTGADGLHAADEHVPLAVARRRVLRAVRRRRLRLRRLRPRVRPHDREPDDRQGRRRPAGQRRRRDGRGVRRLRRARGHERAPHRAGSGLRPYTEGAYVTATLQRHPRLPRRPADGREFPQPGHEPRHRSAQLRRLRLRPTGPEVHADGEIWVAVQMRHAGSVPRSATRRAGRSQTSRASAAGWPPRIARATGAGSSSTTTRWC